MSRYRAERYLVPWYIVGLLLSVYISRCLSISADQRFQLFGYHHFGGWRERIMISCLDFFVSIVYAQCIYLHSTYCPIMNTFNVKFMVVRIMEDPLGYEIIHTVPR